MLPACLSAYHPPGPRGRLYKAREENDHVYTAFQKVRSVRLQADLTSPAKAGHYVPLKNAL